MRPPLASLARRLRVAASNPRIVRRPRFSRALHSAKASLATLDSTGSPTTRQIDIFIGDPGESYIIFERDVGATMATAAALAPQANMESATVPLSFFHESRCFANSMAPPAPVCIMNCLTRGFFFFCFQDATAYPRITIEQDLPRQNVTDMSPATLWLWGASHSITLDGTADRVCASPSLWENLKLTLAARSIRGLFKRESPSVERSRRALEGHVSRSGHVNRGSHD